MEEGWIKEVWEAAKLAGPFGTMLMGLVAYLLNREREKLLVEKDSHLKALRELFDQHKDESDAFRERLVTALNNATIAITTNASNLDSIRNTLNILAGFLNRSDRRPR